MSDSSVSSIDCFDGRVCGTGHTSVWNTSFADATLPPPKFWESGEDTEGHEEDEEAEGGSEVKEEEEEEVHEEVHEEERPPSFQPSSVSPCIPRDRQGKSGSRKLTAARAWLSERSAMFVALSSLLAAGLVSMSRLGSSGSRPMQ